MVVEQSQAVCSIVSSQGSHSLCRLMETLAKQLEQLNLELAAVSRETTAASVAYYSAPEPLQADDKKLRWQQLNEKEQELLAQRAALQEKLPAAGVHTRCTALLLSTLLAEVAALFQQCTCEACNGGGLILASSQAKILLHLSMKQPGRSKDVTLFGYDCVLGSAP